VGLPRLVLVASAVLALGLGAGAAAVALVGGDEGSEPTAAGSAAAEPVSGSPIRLAGTDVRSGEPVRLRSLTGEPVVLVVWASWSRRCAAQAEPLRRLVTSREPPEVVTVATQDDVAAARSFVEGSGLDVPTIADPDGRIAARLGVRELPTTFFLTSEHRIASIREGPAGPGRLRAGLEAAKEG
jgi:cytochrome c biogenesis protein CcmG, thiol:disulfide interchange protein DsbE